MPSRRMLRQNAKKSTADLYRQNADDCRQPALQARTAATRASNGVAGAFARGCRLIASP